MNAPILISLANGSTLGVSPSDILYVLETNTGCSIYRRGAKPFINSVSPLSLFTSLVGFFSATSFNINVAINSTHVDSYESATNILHTNVLFNERLTLRVELDLSQIISAINTNSGGGSSSPHLLGEIKAYSGTVVPSSQWKLCDGATLNQVTYADLYAIIGDNFTAVPNGTTFDLPNLIGRMPLGAEIGTFDFADIGGEQAVSLLEAHIPSHNHAFNLTDQLGNIDSPTPTGGTILAQGVLASALYNSVEVANVTLKNETISDYGGNTGHNNMPPYLVVNFIIFVG